MNPSAGPPPGDVLRVFEEFEKRKKEELKKNEMTEREELYSQLPPHCLAYTPRRDPNPPPKRDPMPIRVLDPEECFQTCPRIISREEWQARMPDAEAEQMMFRVRPAVFKETDCANCDNLHDCKRIVRLLQMLQMDYLRFGDIAYSFLIAEDGSIFEGRGWAYANEKHRGICAIGYMGFHSIDNVTNEPNDKVLQATYDLIMCGVRKGFISNPFSTGAYSGDSPIELVRDFIQQDEDIDYRTKPEDWGLHYDRK